MNSRYIPADRRLRTGRIRLIRRCQVMATKVSDPDFLRPAHELAAAQAA
jgi:hypothetical protein